MFELTVLGINVILPSILTLLGVALGYRLSGAVESRHETERPLESNRTVELVRGVCVAAASALAIWSAVALRNEWAIWHEDAWMRLPTGVALVALAAAVTTGMNFVWLAWLIRGVAVLTAALAIFPSGEAWGDLLPTKNLWLASITLSTLVAWFLMERRGSARCGCIGVELDLAVDRCCLLNQPIVLESDRTFDGGGLRTGLLELIEFATRLIKLGGHGCRTMSVRFFSSSR